MSTVESLKFWVSRSSYFVAMSLLLLAPLLLGTGGVSAGNHIAVICESVDADGVRRHGRYDVTDCPASTTFVREVTEASYASEDEFASPQPVGQAATPGANGDAGEGTPTGGSGVDSNGCTVNEVFNGASCEASEDAGGAIVEDDCAPGFYFTGAKCAEIKKDEDAPVPEFEANIAAPKDTILDAAVCSDGRGLDFDQNEAFECDCDSANGDLNGQNCDLIRVAEVGTNVLAGLAALAVVGGIMYGAYLYMIARDNPGQVSAARTKIVWALVALGILLFFWGFLQWLIPGGLFDPGTPDFDA